MFQQKKSLRPGRIRMFTREPGPLPLPLLATLLILLVFGLVMLFSASYTTSFLKWGNSYKEIRGQLLYAAAGLFAMWVASRVDYHWLRQWALIGYILVNALLVVALFCAPINNTRRWIHVSGVSGTLQVSELAKFEIILYTAALMCRWRSRRKNPFHGILFLVVPLVPILLLLKAEPHYSAIILICGIVAVMIVLGGSGGIWTPLGIGAGGILLVVMLKNIETTAALAARFFGEDNTLTKRLVGFASDDPDAVYQTKQSLYAIASGGWNGLGLGNSIEKQAWLPESMNDFVFSVVCEELGFIGAMIVIVLFALLLLQCLYVAFEAADLFGTFIALGVMAQIGLQTFCNIGVVSDTLPNTGISLPFFSSGGTSLTMLLAEMGVLFSIARAGEKARQERREKERLQTQTEAAAPKGTAIPFTPSQRGAE